MKRWQEYTEELYKKHLNDPDNHKGVIIHLETDILECEVKWALRSITMNKASGGDGIPVELFQILNMMLKYCAQYARIFGKSAVDTEMQKHIKNETLFGDEGSQYYGFSSSHEWV